MPLKLEGGVGVGELPCLVLVVEEGVEFCTNVLGVDLLLEVM